ncbi:MAG: sortase [Actinomycetota bacterium]|nr:sortase [Actinomycetota bacterium]
MDVVGLNPDATLAVPSDAGVAAWYRGGPRPGEVGPAIVTGHLDSTRGPGVFSRLGSLLPGAAIDVVRADGSRVRFVVERVERHDKRRFATHRVYGPTAVAALRLITCGGDFDRDAGSYRDNVVVFAAVEEQPRPEWLPPAPTAGARGPR